MSYDFSQYEQSRDYIASKINARPETVIILGSGLRCCTDFIVPEHTLFYKDIPYFPVSQNKAHDSCLAIGCHNGRCVAVLKGRKHFYEGGDIAETVYALRTLFLLGAKILILTNAAGAVNTSCKPGDIALLTDHINLTGHNVLAGENIEEFGPRFPDMTEVYSKNLRDKALAAADSLQIPLHKSVYYYFTGPSYETPAEIRAVRALGGDLVGMSTVHEAVAASHMGMEVCGFSVVTNMAAGMTGEKLSDEEVVINGQKAQQRMEKLLSAML